MRAPPSERQQPTTMQKVCEYATVPSINWDGELIATKEAMPRRTLEQG
jgi:hypothetical protein